MKTFAMRDLALGFIAVLSGSNLVAASAFKHIVIDGSFADWAGVAPAYSDPQDAARGTDLKDVYLAHDDQFLYVRFTLYAPGNPFTAVNNFFFDADNDNGTGYRVSGVGSELLIQSGVGYRQTNALEFTSGAIDGLDWAAAPEGVATEFEFRVSRQARNQADGSLVFTNSMISVLLEAEDSNFARMDTAPDSGGILYEFTAAPPLATGTRQLVSLTTTSWQVNDANVDLGTAWRELDYDDTQAGWHSGVGLFGYTPTPGDYPAPIGTPLATGRSTYYFRTRFNWNNDSAGIVLVASNQLSVGAVYYLNGAEVERLRVTNQPVTFNALASGGPAIRGGFELLAFPSSALVVGENVLAVETHPTLNGTSMVFGLALLAADRFPVFITDSRQPANRTVVEGEATTFIVKAAGSEPLAYQWLKNGSPVPGATNVSYTITQVLQGDAGNYSVRVSNALSTGVTSRVSVLTTRATALQFDPPDQPTNRTILQGQSTTFAVSVLGSPPVAYQWFKEGTPIPEATNATYTIANARGADTGGYRVVASNRVSQITSRTAALVVAGDTEGPLLERVTGSPNTVTLTFSEPVDLTTAGATRNFQLDRGVTVTGAQRAAGNPRVVVLTTSQQTLGRIYTVRVTNVLDLLNNPAPPDTRGTFRSTILIDGSFDDWAGLAPQLSDPPDMVNAADFADIYLFDDESYLYARFTTHTPIAPSAYHLNLFFDGDGSGSGYSAFGISSDLLIQDGGGYQEKNGGFNEGPVLGLDWALAPAGSSTDFEFRISRAATYGSDGGRVFTSDMIKVVFESETSGFVQQDVTTGGGISYTFARPRVGPLRIEWRDGQISVSWPGAGTLQSRRALNVGEWEDEADQSNPQPFNPLDAPKFFRLLFREE